jgi:hypothetical protein
MPALRTCRDPRSPGGSVCGRGLGVSSVAVRAAERPARRRAALQAGVCSACRRAALRATGGPSWGGMLGTSSGGPSCGGRRARPAVERSSRVAGCSARREVRPAASRGTKCTARCRTALRAGVCTVCRREAPRAAVCSASCRATSGDRVRGLVTGPTPRLPRRGHRGRGPRRNSPARRCKVARSHCSGTEGPLWCALARPGTYRRRA